jgi:hypothetical protein
MREENSAYYFLTSILLLGKSLFSKKFLLLLLTPLAFANSWCFHSVLASFYSAASSDLARCCCYSAPVRYPYFWKTLGETANKRMNNMENSPELSLSSADADKEEESNNTRPSQLHFCFLVHGFMGNDNEMSYIETALNQAVIASSSDNEKNNQKFFFHKATCNVDKTYDGIGNGGKRLAEEIKDYVKRSISHIKQSQHSQKCDKATTTDSANITISFVGNSLGGLYSRYAIAELFNDRHGMKNGFVIHDGEEDVSIDGETQQQCKTIQVYFNVFATTACPHLGVHRHTYITLPRFLEKASALFLGETGRDLFRLTGLLREMTLAPKYLDPLGSFRHRIAYSNAHNTDFQVPTKTAAFLCENSRYPHIFQRCDKFLTSPWIAGIFQTKKMDKNMYEIISEYKTTTAEHNTDEVNDQIELSVSLDSLGWKKVFVDVRDLLPFSIRIPWINEKTLLEHTYTKGKEKSEEGCADDIIFESRELIPFVTASNRLSVPLGHTTMVANSKTEFISWLNSKGRSVMDNFAIELINDMKSWIPE